MNREVARFNLLVLETRVMSRENDDDWMTRVEILYKSVTGTEFKHKNAWSFLKDKHKWKNLDSTNARRNRGHITDDEPELFGDDELPRPPGKQRIAKSQRCSNLAASSGSNSTMFQEMLQQQYELARKEKMERLDRKTMARVELFNSQKVSYDLKFLQMVTRGMDPVDAAIINAQKPGSGLYINPKTTYAKIPKLYRAYELRDKNEQLHVFDSEDTLEDAEKRDIKEMKDAFEQNDVYLDEIENQNDLNKDLHDEIERISKESKDVSNESKTVDTACNDAFEVKRELSKVEIKECDEVKVKDDFDEIETKNIELEYRVASLIKENEHLKLNYKNLFDSIKKSRFQTKTSNVIQDEAENLKYQLFEFAETKFKNILGKIEFVKKKQLDIYELNKGSGENVCDNAKCELQTKIVELKKVLTQQTKDFNDVKLELSNRTAKFEAYFEKLEKMKVILKRQLARKVDDSKAEKGQFLKEINHLRTQLENLKGKSVQTKFDKHSILGNTADKLLINSQISKSWFSPKVMRKEFVKNRHYTVFA
ncbi:hypothetical protein Tco_0051166 [Tanacetum coccineum]